MAFGRTGNVERPTAQWLMFDDELKDPKQADRIEEPIAYHGQGIHYLSTEARFDAPGQSRRVRCRPPLANGSGRSHLQADLPAQGRRHVDQGVERES